jgi:hypothetical protein
MIFWKVGIIFKPTLKNKSMRLGMLLFVLLLCPSYIPISIAPFLREGEVIKSRKLVRKAPLKYAFGFNDPKDANEF